MVPRRRGAPHTGYAPKRFPRHALGRVLGFLKASWGGSCDSGWKSLIPMVLLSIMVQLFAPVAAFRMVVYAASDPLLGASICHDSAASPDVQTAPAQTQHDHGNCCVLCAAGHGVTPPVDPRPFIFVNLQRLYQRVSWLEAAEAVPTVRVGSNAQARAPPVS